MRQFTRKRALHEGPAVLGSGAGSASRAGALIDKVSVVGHPLSSHLVADGYLHCWDWLGGVAEMYVDEMSFPLPSSPPLRQS